MFGSIFVGLSGMNAFSKALRQISNNITNVNSNGFKSSDVTFENMCVGTAGRSGLGVAMADPHVSFAQGELRDTGRDLDLAIDGGGLLVLLKDGQMTFTRTGSFEVDDDGYIVLQGTDQRLAVLDENGAPTAVSVDAYRVNPPKATTTIKFADNLSSTAATFSISNVQVFDAQGESQNWQVKFDRDTTQAGVWTVTVLNSAGTEIGRQTLKFNNGVVDPLTSSLTFTDGGRSATFDFFAASSFSSGDVSSLRVASADGYGAGAVSSIGVNENGEIEIAYTNSQKKTLGAVALASFRDPSALHQLSDGLFTNDTLLRPDFVTSAAKTAGTVVSGKLEASNVDLSKEFGELILVQRGFQASSQVVSVSNDMIQQLFGIRGQG